MSVSNLGPAVVQVNVPNDPMPILFPNVLEDGEPGASPELEKIINERLSELRQWAENTGGWRKTVMIEILGQFEHQETQSDEDREGLTPGEYIGEIFEVAKHSMWRNNPQEYEQAVANVNGIAQALVISSLSPLKKS